MSLMSYRRDLLIEGMGYLGSGEGRFRILATSKVKYRAVYYTYCMDRKQKTG
jgi:hypothetical protein